MGFTAEQIQVHETPQNLQGYQGDTRGELAEVIIPRSAVGGSSNDIGFKLQEDGTYGVIISDFDKRSGSSDKGNKHSKGMRGYGHDWLEKLNQRYAYNNVCEELSNQGFFIEEEVDENGDIVMTVDASTFGG